MSSAAARRVASRAVALTTPCGRLHNQGPPAGADATTVRPPAWKGVTFGRNDGSTTVDGKMSLFGMVFNRDGSQFVRSHAWGFGSQVGSQDRGADGEPILPQTFPNARRAVWGSHNDPSGPVNSVLSRSKCRLISAMSSGG